MAKYFYTPIFNDPDGRIDPGMDDGTGTLISAMPELPPGVTLPMCDRGAEQRFVVVTPDSFEILLGWTEKTKEEVNADYMDLIP